MAANTMGFDLGLNGSQTCFKRKFRWMFKINDISGEGINALPPLRSSRPSLSFKEMEAQHLNETIYFPSKPEWKPIPLSLYDLRKEDKKIKKDDQDPTLIDINNPVITWIKSIYDASSGKWSPIESSFKRKCTLEMYDGCGNVIEKWNFENAWPQNIEFGELDMSASDVMTIDLTLRYDRAYVIDPPYND
jgi:hypothetical protein